MLNDDERRHYRETTTGYRFVCVGERAIQVRARYIAYVTRLLVDLAVYQIRGGEDSSPTFFLRRQRKDARIVSRHVLCRG